MCDQGQAGTARGLAVPVHPGCTVPGPALTPAPEHPGAGDPCLNPGKALEPVAGELTPLQGPAEGQRAVFSDGMGCGSEHPRCRPIFLASWLGQSRVHFRPGFENPVRTASGHRAIVPTGGRAQCQLQCCEPAGRPDGVEWSQLQRDLGSARAGSGSWDGKECLTQFFSEILKPAPQSSPLPLSLVCLSALSPTQPCGRELRAVPALQPCEAASP